MPTVKPLSSKFRDEKLGMSRSEYFPSRPIADSARARVSNVRSAREAETDRDCRGARGCARAR